MENIRNRVDIKLVNYKIQTEKLSAKPNFDHCSIFRFDTSDYPPDHPSGIPSGFDKKVLGMLKTKLVAKL